MGFWRIWSRRILFVWIVCSLLYGFTDAQKITTIAGGSIGDGMQATDAFLLPQGIAVDGDGTIYFSDTAHHKIRKVAVSGIITSIAGTGTAGFSFNRGRAEFAMLRSPSGLALDREGNLFFADSGNGRIRKIDKDGIITTVAGNGGADFSGDHRDALEATLNSPQGVFVDSTGKIYIADTGHNRVRMVDELGLISTIAGNGSYTSSGDGGLATQAGVTRPTSVYVDASGYLYITESWNDHRVRRVDLNGVIETIAGIGPAGHSGDGGPATEAAIRGPSSITGDSDGNLYISVWGYICKIDPQGRIFTIAGIGPDPSGKLPFEVGYLPALQAFITPAQISLGNDGSLYFADRDAYRIRKLSPDGMVSDVAGNSIGDGGKASDAYLRYTESIFIDAKGSLYIAEKYSQRVRKIDPDGVIHTILGNARWRVNSNIPPVAVHEEIDLPQAIHVNEAGDIYVASGGRGTVWKIDQTSGNVTLFAGSGWSPDMNVEDGTPATKAYLGQQITDIYGHPSEGIFIATRSPSRVFRVDSEGKIWRVAGIDTIGFSGDGGPARLAKLNSPSGLAVDTEGNLFISDTGNHRVRRVDRQGIIQTVAGNHSAGWIGGGGELAINRSLRSPTGLYVDRIGNLFIADSGNHCIRKVDINGYISTIAGNPVAGFAGDNTDAVNARLNNPTDVFGDSRGNIYIADRDNHRIRKIAFADRVLDLHVEPDTIVADGLNICTITMRILDSDGQLFSDSKGFNFLVVAKDTLDFLDPRGFFSLLPSAQVRVVGIQPGNVNIQVFEGNLSASADLVVVAPKRKIALSAEVNRTLPDTLMGIILRAQILDQEGVLQAMDDSTVVYFEKVPRSYLPDSLRNATLTDSAVRVTAGIAETAIIARTPEELSVLAKANHSLSATIHIKIDSLPADPFKAQMAIDLDLRTGYQGFHQTNVLPKIGELIGVDLVVKQGATAAIGFQAILEFDKSQVGFAQFYPRDLMATATVLPPNVQDGSIVINAAILGGTAPRDSGSLGHVLFRTLEGYEKASVIRLTSGSFGYSDKIVQARIDTSEGFVQIGGDDHASSIPGSGIFPDFNGDGRVGFQDFIFFAEHFGRTVGDSSFDLIYDLDRDGTIGFGDFLIFAHFFGTTNTP